jgi:hypothetical protein
MRVEYRAERRVIQRTTEAMSIRRTITLLQARIDECERFYPWPALVQSLKADIEMLRARLNDPAH